MTKEEAEAKVVEHQKTGPDWFCPLIKGDCNPRCYSINKAFAQQTGYHDDVWAANEAYCSAHALVGE